MEQGLLIQIGLPIALFIIMIGMGMTLALGDFRKILIYPRGTVVGTVAQILLMPLIAFALASFLRLPGPIAVGLVIVAACPGGTTSNLFAFLARGNVALSIVLTVLASLLTILTLPLFTNMSLQLYMDTSEQLSLPVLKTIATLVVIILIPVSIGMWLRVKAPGAVKRAEGVVSLFGMLVLAGLIVALVIDVGDQLGPLLRAAGPAVIALNLCGIALGFISSRLFGISPGDALTIAIELGIKNGTLGLLITLTLLDSSEMSTPSAVYSLVMFAFGVLLIGYGRLMRGRPQAPLSEVA